MEHGAQVVISSRKQDQCDQVAKEINDKFGKGKAIAIAANISSKENLQNLVDESTRALRQDRRACLQRGVQSVLRTVGRHLRRSVQQDSQQQPSSPTTGSSAWLLPQMIARKDGSIIIVSSIGGLKGSTILGAYAISKAADMQLARNLACEYGPHNVRVNCIAPGLIKTDFSQGACGTIRIT